MAGLAVIWCIVTVALHLSFIGLSFNQNGLALPARVTLDAILIWIPLTEASLICIVMGGLKGLWQSGRSPARLLAGILIPVAIAFSAGFLLAVTTGWVFRAKRLALPKPSLLRAAIVDLGSLAALMTFREIFFFVYAIGAALLVASLLFRLTPNISGGELKKLAAIAVVNCLALLFLCRIVPAHFSQRANRRMEAVLTADFLPSASLFWANLLLPNRPEDLRVSEPLLPLGHSSILEKQGRHPNIILISVESLRAGEESRIVDSEYVMPTLHRLASEGVHFRRAYSPSNESAYSLSAILTSRYPLKTPVRDSFQNPPAPYVRIYDLLPKTYATGFFSADTEDWQNMKTVSWSPRLDRFFDATNATAGTINVPAADTGFSDFLRKKRLQKGFVDDGYVVHAFEDWVDHLGQPNRAKPFFVLLKLESSHFPYQQGLNVPVRFSPAELSPAETRSLSFIFYPYSMVPRMQNRYWNSLSFQDGLIGGLLDHLRDRKALEDTVIMVFGDHGELFYENGAITHADRLLDGTLHTAFVMWGAKEFASPLEYEDPVSLLDIGPLVLRLAGVAPYSGFQGQVPAALDTGGTNEETSPRPIFSVIQNLRFEESVLVGPWRYVLQSDGLYETLNDVVRDPFETNDQVKSRPEVVECLYATLIEFRRNQLGYYNRPELIRSYFPPRHRLADIPACASLRQGHF